MHIKTEKIINQQVNGYYLWLIFFFMLLYISELLVQQAILILSKIPNLTVHIETTQNIHMIQKKMANNLGKNKNEKV